MLFTNKPIPHLIFYIPTYSATDGGATPERPQHGCEGSEGGLEIVRGLCHQRSLTFALYSEFNVVKTKAANALGLYDMSGNGWEWNYNWHPSYVGSYRVLRGGGWVGTPGSMQVGNLNNNNPYNENNNIGFRPSSTGAFM
jgi:formylglycine-generating enzyme required for sulfatase activity